METMSAGPASDSTERRALMTSAPKNEGSLIQGSTPMETMSAGPASGSTRVGSFVDVDLAKGLGFGG